MFSVDNDKSVNSFEHLMEALFKCKDIFDYATQLYDLLIAQEEKAREPFSLLLNVLCQALHESLQLADHPLSILFQVILLEELLVSHQLCLLKLAHGLPVRLVYFAEECKVVWHLLRHV